MTKKSNEPARRCTDDAPDSGARENNLRNITVELPRDKLVVITGVSGSGKSSLAFDTLYAEGQRRLLASMSAFAKRFVNQLRKPDVDFVQGFRRSFPSTRKPSEAIRVRPSAR